MNAPRAKKVVKHQEPIKIEHEEVKLDVEDEDEEDILNADEAWGDDLAGLDDSDNSLDES